MIKKLTLTATVAAIALSSTASYARNQIRIVGSSTVYPFATVVAEEFGKQGNKTPIIESTGTGGGFKLFCAGIGDKYPDFSDASRAIKSREVKKCASNGIKEITELKIGYDGIVLANSVKSKRYSLTKAQIFKALAKKVPLGGKLVNNFYQTWNEIDSSLPNVSITVYGSPPMSGTRDAFSELVLEKACKNLPAFKAAYPNKKARKKACHLIREDGKYVEIPENYNLTVQKLTANRNALGIFGFSYLDKNRETVQGSIIEGVEPTFDNISSGKYSVSRPLFIYAKNAHAKLVKGFRGFVKELISDESIGEEGYLIERGLIPLGKDELSKVQKAGNSI